MSKKDGGPAFPTPFGCGDQEPERSGMSLRDWFAGQAMTGKIQAIRGGYWDARHMKQAAEACYKIADAMIAERENSNG